ncbi:hypothetical protein MMC22_010470 [Lobaria immixta]|nr:hypothetical protein [Lobaria immixta]
MFTGPSESLGAERRTNSSPPKCPPKSFEYIVTEAKNEMKPSLSLNIIFRLSGPEYNKQDKPVETIIINFFDFLAMEQGDVRSMKLPCEITDFSLSVGNRAVANTLQINAVRASLVDTQETSRAVKVFLEAIRLSSASLAAEKRT